MPYLLQVEKNTLLKLKNNVVIGRSLQCAHVINDITISRKHGVFTNHHKHWFITDLSRIGIFINGNKIMRNREVYLSDNYVIQMGSCVFLYSEQKYYSSFLTPVLQSLRIQPKYPYLASEIHENDLMCIICSELYIKAVTLNCQHVFCELCIFKWSKENRFCPLCRAKISVVLPNQRLNYMVCMVTCKLSSEERKRRNILESAHQLALR